VAESPLAVNPKAGWVVNTNNWPYSAAGRFSPKRSEFPAYMDEYLENPRGIHAMALLERSSSFTLESLITAAYDSYLTAFDTLLPPLLADYDRLAPGDSLKDKLSAQVAALRAWDRRWSASSVPTTLAVRWAEQLWRTRDPKQTLDIYAYVARGASARQRLYALAVASDTLQSQFGSWKTPWGEINRFQRISGAIQQPFSDAAPSVPIPFTSSRWGSLAALEAARYDGSKRQYGTSGNSFVAVVEFGDHVRARAISAGGENGDPRSPHFNDQALRYSTGNLRDVYFYESQLEGHTERRYHPGK
jgi:acyl-homoserine-lactone acylase